MKPKIRKNGRGSFNYPKTTYPVKYVYLQYPTMTNTTYCVNQKLIDPKPNENTFDFFCAESKLCHLAKNFDSDYHTGFVSCCA